LAASITDMKAAIGKDCEASGRYTTAMGALSKARGESSTAMGWNSTAEGDMSVAMGEWAYANGNASISMGGYTSSDGPYSVAMGLRAKASGDSSIAMGKDTTASGDWSTAMGYKTIASGEYCLAAGNQSLAVGRASFAMGEQVWAWADNSFAGGQMIWLGSDAKNTFAWGKGGGYTINTPNSFLIFPNGTAGNVGIGKGDPSEKLDIAGGNGRVETGYHWLTNSDARLKKNITTIENSLDRISRLRGVRFDSIKEESSAKDNGRYIGIIAQELEKEYPELVVRDETSGYKAVAYDKLTAVLIEAVKELKTQIERQSIENEKQQTEINRLRELVKNTKM